MRACPVILGKTDQVAQRNCLQILFNNKLIQGKKNILFLLLPEEILKGVWSGITLGLRVTLDSDSILDLSMFIIFFFYEISDFDEDNKKIRVNFFYFSFYQKFANLLTGICSKNNYSAIWWNLILVGGVFYSKIGIFFFIMWI